MGQSNAAKMLAQLFKTIDRDDSGSIEKHEFLAYLDGRLPAVGATMSVLGAAKDKRDELRQAVLHANCEMIQELVEVDECNLHWDLVNQPPSTSSLPAHPASLPWHAGRRDCAHPCGECQNAATRWTRKAITHGDARCFCGAVSHPSDCRRKEMNSTTN